VTARFFAPEAAATGDLIALPDEEAQHLRRVLRLAAGERVRVFNGRGGEFTAAVEHAARDGVHVRLLATNAAAPEPRLTITLVQAVLKGDKMDDVVRDAVMLGVGSIQPVVSTRTEVSLAALERSHRRDRWARIAVSSAKQCGRAVVPMIAEPRPFAEIPIAVHDLALPAPALMLVEPGASADTVALGDLDPVAPAAATVIIGPEGGWTADEIQRAAPSCRLVSLGGRTIRADVMAVVAIAALFARSKEF
jgi:16S rRNA (uracil1498-N3)-methyltransferase